MARVTSSQSAPFSYGLKELTVGGHGIHPGIIEFNYYESLLQDSVVATATYADSGVNGPGGKSVIEGLPVVGGEEVKVSFNDSNGVTISVDLFLKNDPTVADKTTTGVYNFIMVSEEIRTNNRTRVPIRFDGKPHEHVTQILTDYLKTKKKLDIETTLIPRNFYGANKKPIYLINWLAQHSVPEKGDAFGKTAGFFYYETSDGIMFKSIESLFDQEPKSKIIFNQTPDKRGEKIPPGYDVCALSYQKTNRNDVDLKEQMGAYSNRIINFNPFDGLYEIKNYTAEEFMGAYKLGGKKMPTGGESEYTRTTYYIRDIGTLPTGSTPQQIEKSKEENFRVSEIRNQAIMRYNQLFISQVNITIPSDYTLHVGDVVLFDAPSQQENLKNDEVDKQVGGLYIIAALCHYVTPKENLTNLTLVRDSFGRKT
jgi:hypothetical protein